MTATEIASKRENIRRLNNLLSDFENELKQHATPRLIIENAKENN